MANNHNYFTLILEDNSKSYINTTEPLTRVRGKYKKGKEKVNGKKVVKVRLMTLEERAINSWV